MPLETQIVQRSYDGRWEKVCGFADHENSYTFVNEAGLIEELIPNKWIVVQVYDFITEIVR